MKKTVLQLITAIALIFNCLLPIDSFAQYTGLLDFNGTNGANPTYGELLSDGTFLYGMTLNGGANNTGTLFKIKPDGTGYIKLLDFVGTNGINPWGSLISDGTFLYGMTSGGGGVASAAGTVFKIKPDGTGYVKLLTFTGANGASPYGSLIFDGTFLYGMTQYGGTDGVGTVFKIMPDGTGYLQLLDFNSANGESPTGSLISDGTFLYGMTQYGGTSGAGKIFKIKPDGTGYTSLLNFNFTNSGYFPTGSLISNGTFLYGMTSTGGAGGGGAVFKIMPDGTGYANLLDFNGANGSTPYGSLNSDGTFLYGLTAYGGTSTLGSIFKIMPDGTGYANLFDFTGINGSSPYGSLISEGGFLYGMTQLGSTNNQGNVFKLDVCPPLSQTVTPASTNFICSGNVNINLGSTETGLNYYLRNDANDSIIAGPVAGTGSTLNLNTGTISSSSTFNVYAARPTTALDFDGTNDKAVVADHASLNISATTDFTAEAWIKYSTSVPDYSGLVVKATAGSPWTGYQLVLVGNKIAAEIMDGTTMVGVGQGLIGTTVLNDGKWHHVAMVIDRTAGKVKLFVDGTVEADVVNSVTDMTNAANMYIGVERTNGTFFQGRVDEVRIWNTARKTNQIYNAQHSCLMGTETGLVAYYRFEDGTGSSTVTDIAGGDNNGVLTNMDPATDWITGVDNCGCSLEMATKPMVTVNPIANQTPTATQSTFCDNGSTTINLSSSEIGVNYYLRLNSNNNIVAGPTAGTGSALSFNTGTINATTIYHVYAVKATDATCNSLMTPTITLTINNSSTGDTTAVACNSFTWYGATLTTSGSLGRTFTNVAGCDSIVTLHLTIKNSTTGDTSALACNTFNWYGTNYTTSGTPTKTLTNAVGCDSILRLNLTILNSTASTDVHVACDSFTWINGITYFASNSTATVTLQNVVTCDSIVTLDLTINNADTSVTVAGNTLTADATGAVYQWLNCDNGNSEILNETNRSFTPTANGNYAVVVTEGSCSDTSSCYNVIVTGISEHSKTDQVSVYPNPNTGSFVVRSNVEGVYTLVNSLGQRLQVIELTTNNNAVTINNLDNGVYFIINNKGLLQQKIVVVK